VRNRNSAAVINRFGQPCPEVYGEKTIVAVAEALRANGHEAAILEADMSLLPALEAFIPSGRGTEPQGMVFNMAYGIQGECRYTHVPAMLEMAGVPYTGSSPLGHSLALDKVITKKLMMDAGIPTPKYRVMRTPADSLSDLRFPLVVKPTHESTSFGLRLAADSQELSAAVAHIVHQYQQEALVEEYIDGREVCAALLGNDDKNMEFLPLVEQDFGNRPRRIVTWEDKFHKVEDETRKLCPAPVDEHLAQYLRQISLAVFKVCKCRDYARVDIRIDSAGLPYVLEINSMASLGNTGSYMLAAQTAGYSFATLANKIVDVAHERYFGGPAPRQNFASASQTALRQCSGPAVHP
jgi:D-alanine-D-alanine ligase